MSKKNKKNKKSDNNFMIDTGTGHKSDNEEEVKLGESLTVDSNTNQDYFGDLSEGDISHIDHNLLPPEFKYLIATIASQG